MSHKSSKFKPPFDERSAMAVTQKGRNGEVVLMCPFCKPTHVLSPVNLNGCGAMVEMRVVQRVFHAKYNKAMKCVKCGEGGGDMVQFQNGLVHLHDCKPGVAALVEMPEYSKIAGWVYNLPKLLRTSIERFAGETKQVKIVGEDGKTQEVKYIFYRSPNGKHTQARASKSVS